MHSRSFIAVCCALILGAALSGCASLGTALPGIDEGLVTAEKTRARKAAFSRYLADNARLQRLATPILQANAELCQKTRKGASVQTAKLSSFPKPLREIASEVYGYAGAEPRIIYAADKALIGMEIIGPKGQTINARSADETSRIATRDDRSLTLIPGERQCDYPVRLKYSPAINAYADGRSITVTTGMMDFATDAELGLIIGHELAHNTQSHVRKIIQNTVLALGRGTFARQFESEADYVGLYYSARAGYAISDVADFWKRLSLQSVKRLDIPKSHPVSAERYIRLRAAVAEIKAKQLAGAPVEPNPK